MKRIGLVLLLLVAATLAIPPLYYAVFVESEPATALPPAGRRVDVSEGLAVNIVELGDGPAVVFVHGHPGSAYDWAPTQREVASRGRRTIAYDRVGYGYSDRRPRGPFTVENTARDLLGLLEALDLRGVTVVGHSYGGGTAILAAKRDASRIARLVLVGSVGPGIENRGGPPPFVVELLAGPVLSWVERVPPARERFRREFAGAAFHPAPVPDWFLAQSAANFAMPHTRETFRSEGRDLGGEADLDPAPIAVPIVVVHGDQDRLVPFAIGEALAKGASDAELRRVDDAGHMLPVTHAALLADVITSP